MARQTTIRSPVTYSGIGLHTGNQTTVRFKPAPVDSGITFVRTDLPDSPVIEADVANVVDVTRGTTIGKDGVCVLTIEHLLAAIAGLDIDNLLIELDGDETPVGDGSSLPVVEVLLRGGVAEQEAEKRHFRIAEPVTFQDEDISLAVFPSEQLRVTYTIDYTGHGHSALAVQSGSFLINRETFKEEIAPARTYCFLNWVEDLQKMGLIKGGSLENAVVIGPDGIVNDELRFSDEFVRHKVIDLLGDLLLLGASLRGHVVAYKAGHASHVELVRRIRKLAERSESPTTKVPSPGVRKVAPLDINDIKSILPHRYPFLLIDRVLEFERDKKVVAIKSVTVNEPFFEGHFPDRPIMPGVLIVEAMAQAAGIVILNKPENVNKGAYFMAVDKVKFRRPVVPGDQIVVEAEAIRIGSRRSKFHAKAVVDGAVVAEAEMIFSLFDG